VVVRWVMKIQKQQQKPTDLSATPDAEKSRKCQDADSNLRREQTEQDRAVAWFVVGRGASVASHVVAKTTNRM
jgi:hypothetical protein